MTAAIVTLILLAWLLFKPGKEAENFTEFFRSLQEDSLRSRGWLLKSTKRSFWSRRNEQPGALTLFTIPGDNWPDSVHQPLIHNLLLRIVSNQCFTAELHFSNFVPLRNWQQAGILLLEDSSLSSKSLRLSIAYNDYSGGLSRIPSILVQAIISPGGHSLKPEEIVHHELFNPDRDSSEVIRLNLSHSALRVEKKGNQIRLLFSDGAFANSAFKELFSGEFNFEPAYVGIFALKGFTGNDGIMPVRISYFSLNSENCTP
jgi:hypothetical protein